ncbi:MAG: hypothetical protein WCG48_03875 [Candidatus Berkelbacteria bacterium]
MKKIIPISLIALIILIITIICFTKPKRIDELSIFANKKITSEQQADINRLTQKNGIDLSQYHFFYYTKSQTLTTSWVYKIYKKISPIFTTLSLNDQSQTIFWGYKTYKTLPIFNTFSIYNIYEDGSTEGDCLEKAKGIDFNSMPIDINPTIDYVQAINVADAILKYGKKGYTAELGIIFNNKVYNEGYDPKTAQLVWKVTAKEKSCWWLKGICEEISGMVDAKTGTLVCTSSSFGFASPCVD